MPNKRIFVVVVRETFSAESFDEIDEELLWFLTCLVVQDSAQIPYEGKTTVPSLA